MFSSSLRFTLYRNCPSALLDRKQPRKLQSGHLSWCKSQVDAEKIEQTIVDPI